MGVAHRLPTLLPMTAAVLSIGTELTRGELTNTNARWLAERILEDRLPVRMQIQLHKHLWGSDRTGV